MKAVMISIQPKWVEKIVSGEKTIEVRKTVPKLETPFKCFIYMTKSNSKITISKDNYAQEMKVAKSLVGGCSKVIGEFICDEIIDFWCEKDFYLPTGKLKADTCLTNTEFYNYGKGKPLYGLHISNLKIYDKPKEINEFRKLGKEYHDIKENEKGHLTFIDGYIEGEPLTRPPQSWCYVEE